MRTDSGTHCQPSTSRCSGAPCQPSTSRERCCDTCADSVPTDRASSGSHIARRMVAPTSGHVMVGGSRRRRGERLFLLLRSLMLALLSSWVLPRIRHAGSVSAQSNYSYYTYNRAIKTYDNHTAQMRRDISSSDDGISAELLWEVPAGCATVRMCCAGRNHTCKASAAPAAAMAQWEERATRPHRTKRLTKLFEFRAGERFPPVLTRRGRQRVGELILPDTVALDGRGARYARIFGQKEGLQVVELEKRPSRRHRRRHAAEASGEYLVFGAEIEDPPTPEIVIFERSRPLIRYSVLNKFLPLRIGKVTKKWEAVGSGGVGSAGDDNDELDGRMRVMYVTEVHADCYCDAQCVVYADCCHDYAQFCRPTLPTPCAYASWSRWSECRASLPLPACGGEGVQTRTRKILRGSANPACTRRDATWQNRGCWAPCQRMRVSARIEPDRRRPTGAGNGSTAAAAGGTRSLIELRPKKSLDVTTVALLLDYRYNSSRMYAVNRPEEYYRYQTHISSNSTSGVKSAPRNTTNRAAFQLFPFDDPRFDPTRHIFYCVHYELGWVNRNCVERRYKSALFRRNRICVECQPHAQLHRNEPRCASDLEDGDRGLWKLIGPPYCNGIWQRLSRTDNCTCGSHFPHQHAFLMV